MNKEKSELIKAFDGMSNDQSVDHQVKHWAEGIPLHNTVRDECCPDFSCCNSGSMMPTEARNRLLKAHQEGDYNTVQSICMMGLSGLVVDCGANIHLIGEGHKDLGPESH